MPDTIFTAETQSSETVVDLSRLKGLSDGVFAFALTLLVLDIRVPETTQAGELTTTLIGLAPRLLIYLISFVVIGGAWGSHQRMLSQIRRGDGVMVWFNLASLLFVSLLPAGAALLGRFPGVFVAIVCFAADVILIQLTALWLWRHASIYKLLNESLDPLVVRSIGRRLILSAVCFALSVALIVFHPYLVYVGWIALSLLIFTTDWLSWQQAIKTTQIAIALDGATRGDIAISHAVGRLNLLSNVINNTLIHGTCRGEVDTSVVREGEVLKARLSTLSGQGITNRHYPWTWELPASDWNLSLNPDLPLTLQIQKGVGEIDIDLTGTQLTDLQLIAGDSSLKLRLPAEAKQTSIHIQAGITDVTIDVPSGVAACMRVGEAQANIDIDEARFPPVEKGKEYRSSNYETAANRVEIHLELGQGSIRII